MALVEGIGGELLPVGPYLLEHLLLMAVLHPLAHEFHLELRHLVNLLLAHGLAEHVAFSSGEVGEEARQEHHLLLIDRDAVGLLQILLHDGDVVGNRLLAVLTRYERRNVVHRPRPVEGVHGYEVLEFARLELAQRVLHPLRLKLERGGGVSVAVELEGGGVIERYVVDVEVYAAVALDVLEGLLDDGERLEAEEVHLDQTGLLNHAPLVLSGDHLRAVGVGGHGDRHPVGDVVAADDHAAGVDAGAAHVPFELSGIVHHLPDLGVGALHLRLEFRHVFRAVGEVDRRVLAVPLRQPRRHELRQTVRLREGQLHHFRHILDGRFGGHGLIGDDVGHFLLAVFVGDVFQYLISAVVVEVHVDIGERYTVGVEESLEKEIVFDGIHLGDAEAIGRRRAGCGATSRPYADAQLLACHVDEVLHDEEVSREAHGLHYIQLEFQTLLDILRQRVAVALPGAGPCELLEVVGLELYAVELVVAAEPVDLLLRLLLAQHHIAVLVAGELVEEFLMGDAFAVFLLAAELVGYPEVGHDGGVVDGVELHLVEYLHAVGERLRHIGEYLLHLLPALEPFLLGVVYARLVEALVH